MYTPRNLGAPISAGMALLAGNLRQGRVTLLVGAGFSRGEPTALPLAPQLAEQVYSAFKDTFAKTALENVDSGDLLGVADAIAGADGDGLARLQQYLSADVPFGSAAPNHAHRVLVMLLGEKLLTEAMTTNYDTCVERVAVSLGEPCLASCRKPSERQMGGGKGRILKLHGCVTDQATMLVTSDQLNAPDHWVLGSLVDASTKDTLVIVGINSVAPYVEETLKRVWDYAKNARSIWVVAPMIDASWDTFLGAGNESPKVNETAEEFLDELLHACLFDQITRLKQAARAIDAAGGSGGVASLMDGFFASINDVPVLSLYIALRAGVVDKQDPRPFVTNEIGLQALFALSIIQLAIGLPLKVMQFGDRAWLRLDGTIVHFAHGKGQMTGGELVDTIERELKDAKARGLLPWDTRVLAVASGYIGPLPGKTLPPDIVGDPGADNTVDGPNRVEVVWLPLFRVASTHPDEGHTIVVEALS